MFTNFRYYISIRGANCHSLLYSTHHPNVFQFHSSLCSHRNFALSSSSSSSSVLPEMEWIEVGWTGIYVKIRKEVELQATWEGGPKVIIRGGKFNESLHFPKELHDFSNADGLVTVCMSDSDEDDLLLMPTVQPKLLSHSVEDDCFSPCFTLLPAGTLPVKDNDRERKPPAAVSHCIAIPKKARSKRSRGARRKVGRVPFYVTCSNRLACNEVPDANTTDNYGDITSESILKRFGKLLCLSSVNTPNCDPSNLSDVSQLKSIIGSLLKEESDDWYQMFVQEKISSEGLKEKLLQKQLKEKLYVWLLQKAAESGKGPSVLDEGGQGVLHFAAALGYDWAIEPTVAGGVNIDFRDVNGWTALHWAVYCGRERTVASLVSLGAALGALSDPTPKYPSGRTPTDLASSIGHNGIVHYLAESDVSSHLSVINLNKQDSDAAEIHGAKVVQTVAQRSPTPFRDGDLPYGLSMDSLPAVRNTTQVTAHQVQSFQKKQLKELGDDTFRFSNACTVSFVGVKSHKQGDHDEPVHDAAIRIENKSHRWRGRKGFSIIQQKNVRIQGTTSTQSANVASESLRDYTNEFRNDKTFKSKEALIQCTREVGRKNGFNIVIQRSDSGNRGQKARITFACERGGQYRNNRKNEENRKEKQSGNVDTKKCECPFKLSGYKLDDNDNWMLKVVRGVHNHPVTKPLEGRSYVGRLSKEETSLLLDMSKNKVRPKDIFVRLKNRDATNISTIKQIYNVRHRYKVREKVVSSNNKLKLSTFVSSFPVGLRPYIHHIKDVAADGNCGFRVIADLMGYGENEWLRVRKDLLNELNSNSELYSSLYGGCKRVEELKNALSYFESHPSLDGWMTMPDMGHLIASAYNVVLFLLSSQQCLTFLPLRPVPMPTDSHKDIAIGFVNNNHFVEVFLLPNHPVPPIASNWYKFHHSSVNGWDTVYIPRIAEFKKIIGNDVATDEIIDIDSNWLD